MAEKTDNSGLNIEAAEIVVIGGSGGIGSALVRELLERLPSCNLHATFHSSGGDLDHPRLNWHQLDIRETGQIEKFASTFERVDWIVNCAGYLHGSKGGPEKNIRSFDCDFLSENIRINTMPTLLLAKNFSAALKKSASPVLATVSARVGSIEDNRLGGWYSYRISKAALNMALKTLSIEWKHSHPRGCVAALHPGTNDTALSRPFQSGVAPTDLFDPAYTASCFVDLLSRLGPDRSGQFWTWDGKNLPW